MNYWRAMYTFIFSNIRYFIYHTRLCIFFYLQRTYVDSDNISIPGGGKKKNATLSAGISLSILFFCDHAEIMYSL